MRWLFLTVTLWLASCAFQGLNPEEQSDIVAKTSLDAIHAVQLSAQALYDTDSLSRSDYRNILTATGQLTDLVVRIESAADIASGDVPAVECVSIDLGGEANSVCDRSDVIEILIKLREQLQ